MNKRILKLFTKACYHGDYEPENVPNAVVEKFAELIVRECADIGERYADGNYEVRNQIMVQFGLEEPEE
jgi:hypothetical protein